MYVTNEEVVTFIYTRQGRCIFQTCVSLSRDDLSSRNYIFTLSFYCGADFTYGALYFFFISFYVGMTSLLGSSNVFRGFLELFNGFLWLL